MKKFKSLMITFLIATLVLLKEVTKYKKSYNIDNFSYFIREYFNNVYIKQGDREILNIERLLLVTAFYFLIYYLFYRDFSVNIESFKNIIKYNSKNIFHYYFNVIRFFSSIFIKLAIFNIVIFLMFFKLFFNDTSYLTGILDLIKLPLILYLALLFCVVFPIKRVVVSIITYILIVFYILILNKISIHYTFIIYGIFFVIFTFRLFITKFDV